MILIPTSPEPGAFLSTEVNIGLPAEAY